MLQYSSKYYSFKCTVRFKLFRVLDGEEFEFWFRRIQSELRMDNRKRGLSDQVPFLQNHFHPGIMFQETF